MKKPKAKLLAPNGKPSNLTLEQYALVRTPAFKAWFGDWENSPETSSKVVDENGEPLPVFHGTTKKFNVFDREYAYYQNWYGLGFYFTDRIEDIKSNYTSKGYDLKQKIKVLSKIKNIDKNKIKKDLIEGDYLISVFLDIKKPINIFNKIGKDNSKKIFDIEPILKKKFGYDVYGFLNYIQTRIGGYEVPFEKSFSKYTYWEFENILRNLLIEKENQNITGEVIRAIYEILGFDGIIMNPYHIFNNLEKGTMNVDEKTNHYISFNPTQIKLSDGTNTTFDSNNPDIRFDDGGSLEEGNNNVLEYLFNNTEDITPIKINGRTVGGIDVTTYRGDTETLRVHKMLILPEFQGKGIGAKAINKLFRENPNVKQIIGNATAESKSFWQKIGAEFHSNEHTAFTITRNLDIRFDNGGTTMKAPKLLAPNGKPSNLTPEQYKLVRTPAFKEWFGDWENSPETASKVVDKNGEPKVKWRGDNNPKNVFDYINYGEYGVYYFGDKGFAEMYGDKLNTYFIDCRNPFLPNKTTEKQEKEIRNLLEKDANEILTERIENGGFKNLYNFLDNYYLIEAGFNENSKPLDILLYQLKNGINYFILELRPIIEWLKNNNYNGYESYEGNYDNIAVFNSTQIKLADGTNTTFDSNNPDIRYKNGGLTMKKPKSKLLAPNGKPSNLTPEQYRIVRTPAFKEWFGDWEKAYKDLFKSSKFSDFSKYKQNFKIQFESYYDGVSKFIDENGEPKVALHFTRKWSVDEDGDEDGYETKFDASSWSNGKGEYYYKTPKTTVNPTWFYIETGSNNLTSFFGSVKDEGDRWAIPFFINVKRLFDTCDYSDLKGLEAYAVRTYGTTGHTPIVRDEKRFPPNNKLSGTSETRTDFRGLANVVDCKSYNTIENDYSFSGENTETSGSIPALLKEMGYDGYTIKDEGGTMTIFDKVNYKIADGSNTTFDGSNPNITFDNGGEINQTEELIKSFLKKQELIDDEPKRSYDDMRIGDTINVTNEYVDLPESQATPDKGIYKLMVIPISKTDHFIRDAVNRDAFAYDDYDGWQTENLNNIKKTFDSERREPIIVSEGEDGLFNVIDGHHRLTVANELRRKSILALVREFKNNPIPSHYAESVYGISKSYHKIKLELPNIPNPDITDINFVNKIDEILNSENKYELGGELTLTSEQVEQKLGRKLHWWNDDVVTINGTEYKKVFLKPEYKRL